MNGMLVHFLNTHPSLKVNTAPSPHYPQVSPWVKGMRPRAVSQPGLQGLWDDIVGVVSGKEDFKTAFTNQLDSAQAQLESLLGTFLTTNQKLLDIKGRAQGQMNSSNSTVKDRATAILAKDNALLNQYTNIKNDALALGGQISSLKTQLQSDPVLQMDNPLSMGTRIVQLFNNYKGTVGQVASASKAMYARINQHIKDVNTLNDDMTSIENFAEGKGFAATASSIGGSLLGSYTSIMKPVAVVGVVGLMIYFLAPSLLGRMSKR